MIFFRRARKPAVQVTPAPRPAAQEEGEGDPPSPPPPDDEISSAVGRLLVLHDWR